MSERQETYLICLPCQEAPFTSTKTFDLGQHTLEILEEEGVLLMENTGRQETMQLDEKEAYQLMMELHVWFQQRTMK